MSRECKSPGESRPATGPPGEGKPTEGLAICPMTLTCLLGERGKARSGTLSEMCMMMSSVEGVNISASSPSAESDLELERSSRASFSVDVRSA